MTDRAFPLLARLLLSLLLLAAWPAAAVGQASPSAFTVGMRYDAQHHLTGTIAPDPDGAGPLHHSAVRNSYDQAGRLVKVETGELAAWQSETVAPESWTGFTIFRTLETSYDWAGRKLIDTLREGAAGPIRTFTQYTYDNLGRLACTAVRMNPAAFATHPGSACALGTAGADGPDRITMNAYDAAGQRIQLREGVGTADEGTEATWEYNADGQVKMTIDGNGNRAELHYDGHARQTCWLFPSPVRPSAFNDASQATALATAGAANGNCLDQGDFESYSYDVNGNRTDLRRRDGRHIAFAYDPLNRLSSRTYPQGGATPVFYSYDLRDLQRSARFNSQSGDGVTNAYDGLGNLLSATAIAGAASRTLTYQYDANGNRTHVIHPDGTWFLYTYDGLNRPTYLSTATSWALNQNYFDHGGPWITSRVNGTASGWFYDGLQRPSALGFYPVAATHGAAFGYGRNAAGQIASMSRDNDGYAWTGHYAVARRYTTNGLNQYSDAGPAHFSYDANGNLASGGGPGSYYYDIENRLISAPGAVTLAYDPLGRLYQVAVNGSATTTLLYDGDALVAEYNSAGEVAERYAHWVGADVPMIWYHGDTLADARHLFADERGSIVAVTDGSGATLALNRYDEYGIRGAGNMGRFQYTGQVWLSELGMYYYKARVYSPTLGRFLQTDPIGYQGGNNLYAYVGDDPVNATDPSGECPWCIIGGIIGLGTQAYSEYRSGTLRTWGGVGRVLLAGGAGALSGGASTLIARTVVGAGARGLLLRAGSNAAAGALIGGAQGAGNAGTRGRPPTMGDLAGGARTGAIFSAGGSIFGEAGGHAATRVLSRAVGNGPEDTWIAQSMVELNGRPGGTVPGSDALPSQSPPPIPGSVAGPTLSETISNLTGNAPNVLPPGQSSSHRCRGAPCM